MNVSRMLRYKYPDRRVKIFARSYRIDSKHMQSYIPATACSAVLFFFFLPFSFTLPPLVLPVLTLLTLPLTLPFFFFPCPVDPESALIRPEPGLISAGCIPDRL